MDCPALKRLVVLQGTDSQVNGQCHLSGKRLEVAEVQSLQELTRSLPLEESQTK